MSQKGKLGEAAIKLTRISHEFSAAAANRPYLHRLASKIYEKSGLMARRKAEQPSFSTKFQNGFIDFDTGLLN